jgi:biopolymer transport protein ExbD
VNFRRNDKEQDLEINLTPLIDVVFLLLIFFMVSTTFNESSQLNIELPEANGQQRDNNVLTLSIDEQGHYFLNRKQLLNSQLATIKRVLEKSSPDKDTKLMISADKDTPYQYVVRAMDAARQAGINNFAIETTQVKK